MMANPDLQKYKGYKMAKNIIISEEIVRTRVMRVHSGKLRDSIKNGFVKKCKPQKRLFCNRPQVKKGVSNE